MHTRTVLSALLVSFALSAPVAFGSFGDVHEGIDAHRASIAIRLDEARERMLTHRARLHERLHYWQPRNEEPHDGEPIDTDDEDEAVDNGEGGGGVGNDESTGDEEGDQEGSDEGDDNALGSEDEVDDQDEPQEGENNEGQVDDDTPSDDGGTDEEGVEPDEGTDIDTDDGGTEEGEADGDTENDADDSADGGGDDAAEEEQFADGDDGSEEGEDGEGQAVGAVVLTEVLYDPNPGAGQGNDNDNEWIEVYNGTDGVVDVAGWTIGDGANNGEDVISEESLLVPAGEYLIITRKPSTDDYWTYGEGAVVVHLEGTLGSGGLRNGGESVILQNAEGVVVDAVSWGDATETGYAYVDTTGVTEQGKSIVRSGDSWEISDTPTPGA